MVHFPCGQNAHKFIFQFTGQFMSYCLDHGPQQSSGVGGGEVSLPQSCSVCLDSIQPLLGYSVLKCPSCHSSWFHRGLHTGVHFFRCTLCNNKEHFQEEMLTMGIYIPERDASWELESNAFEDLLEVYERCDAPTCCCRHGREYSSKTGWFEVLRCRLCGSRGTHRRCTGLQLQSSDWACLDCTQTLDPRASLGQEEVLGAALELVRRPDFDPRRRLCVRFKEQQQQKTPFPSSPSGATQLFLRQLVQQIQSCGIFEGPEGSRNLALESRALREDVYFWVGRLLALALLNGGPPLCFFSPALYQSLFTPPGTPGSPPLALHHLTPNTFFTHMLSTMAEARCVEDLKETMSANWEYLELAGCYRPISSLENRDLLVADLVNFSLITRMHLPLQRFGEGLKTLGLFEQVQLHPAVFYSTFCGPEEMLDAHTLRHLLLPQQEQEQGEQEAAILFYWTTFLQECEAGRSSISLQDLLRFTTGVEEVPAVGLLPPPALSFLLPQGARGGRLFPQSDPGSNLLLLPRSAASYQAFKSSLEQA
ncbi:hypothetical protein CRUP_014818, partial [Coryphaenoides rupestris]